jgi:hypothetical protein
VTPTSGADQGFPAVAKRRISKPLEPVRSFRQDGLAGGTSMIGFRHLVAVIAAVVCSILSPNVGSAQPLRHQTTTAHVYVLRSFLVLSSGLFDLAANFRAQGLNATVHNQLEWPFLADQAIINYREGLEAPIIIIGHSSGTNAALSMTDRLAQAGVVPSLVITLDPIGAGVIDGKPDRVVNVCIIKAGVQVARGQTVGDRLVTLELKRHNVWRASTDKSLPTVDQLILTSVSEAVTQGPARRSPPPPVSERVRRRVAAPIADDHSVTRPRPPASDTRRAGRPPTETTPQRRDLSPTEREALFRQFLEWSRRNTR